MAPENLTIESLEKLTKLIKKKKQIQNEASKVDAQISALLGGAVVSSVKTPKVAHKAQKPTKGQRGKRGSTGKKVLGALQAAGAEGITVPELAANTGIKSGSLHAWFATTGKSHVERVARGRYRIKQEEQAQQPQEG